MVHGFLTLDTISPAAAAAGDRVFADLVLAACGDVTSGGEDLETLDQVTAFEPGPGPYQMRRVRRAPPVGPSAQRSNCSDAWSSARRLEGLQVQARAERLVPLRCPGDDWPGQVDRLVDGVRGDQVE